MQIVNERRPTDTKRLVLGELLAHYYKLEAALDRVSEHLHLDVSGSIAKCKVATMESRSSSASETFPPEYFRREDEADDGLFYAEPRLVVHIDEYAIAALGEYFARVLPQNGVILDLMSSWRSHLPEALPIRKLVGLGLNSAEMTENPQLDESMVHNLNSDPVLPFEDQSFDAALVTVSIQYMTRPVEVFNQVNRVLKEGAQFHVIYSNLMFSDKAVWIWRTLDDDRRAQLIGSYFAQSDGWEAIQATTIGPKLDFYSDPLYAVSARKIAVRTE